MGSKRCGAAVGFAVGVLVIGCGESDSPSLRTGEAPSTTDTASRQEDPSQPRNRPRVSTDRSPAPSSRPRKIRRGGATIIVPRMPTATATEPSRGCVAVRHGQGSGMVFIPPTPGLQARRTGQTVSVRYRLSGPLRRCNPERLLVTLDVNDDGQPGITRSVPLRGKVGTLPLAIPRFFRFPDVAKISAVTRRGDRSGVAVVRIVG